MRDYAGTEKLQFGPKRRIGRAIAKKLATAMVVVAAGVLIYFEYHALSLRADGLTTAEASRSVAAASAPTASRDAGSNLTRASIPLPAYEETKPERGNVLQAADDTKKHAPNGSDADQG